MKFQPLLRATLLACTLLSRPTAALQPEAPVRAAVERLLLAETRGLPGRVELDIGPLDPRNQLPPCASPQASLPSGSRAWGRSTVAVRCEGPAQWTIYMPVQVKVFGDYLVLARPLSPGQVVGPSDLERRHGDLAGEADGALLDMTQAVGHPARIAVAAGQILRADMLRQPALVKRGENVRVITAGAGFSVANEGKALNDAVEGQLVRVRLSSGRVLAGTARHDGVVEIRP